MSFARGCAGPNLFSGFTTRTPITPPYFRQAGNFGTYSVVPGMMPGYSRPIGYDNYRPNFGCDSSYYRPYAPAVYPSPYYGQRYTYRSNQGADAAIVGGLLGIALGALFSRRF